MLTELLVYVFINFTLRDALLRCLETNFSLKSAYYNVESALLSAKGSWSAFLPVLVASFNFTKQFKLPEVELQGFKRPVGQKEQAQLIFSINESIPLDGSSYFMKEAKYSAYKSQFYSLENLKNEISYALASLYINISLYQDVIKISEENVRRLQENYEIAKNLFDAGLLSEADLMRIETSFLDSKVNLRSAQIQLENLLKDFFILLGVQDEKEMKAPSQDIDSLIETLKPTKFFDNIRDDEINIREDSPDILSLMYTKDQLKYQSRIQRGRLFPTLNVGFSLFNSYGTFIEQKNIPSLVVGASLNVDFGGSLFSFLATKKAELAIAFQLEEIKVRKKAEINQILKQYRVIKEKIEVAEAKLKAAQRAYESAQELFRQGKLTSVSLLDYELQFENSKLELKSSKANLLIIMLNYLRTSGMLVNFLTSI